MLGLGVGVTDAEGVVEGVVEGVRPVEVAGGVAVPAGVGWVGELGASRAQAAITTRLLAGSALPPTPLRSTK
jgi:hypothetical protein